MRPALPESHVIRFLERGKDAAAIAAADAKVRSTVEANLRVRRCGRRDIPWYPPVAG